MALDAKDKKDAFLQAQSQVNDAQSLASETRRETERLRKAAEDLDIKLASAASMQKPAPPSAPSASNGFPSKAPSYGFGTLPPTRPASNDGFGSQSYGVNGGFNANVMGNRGLSIPTPSGADDPYGNPFG